MGYTVSKCVLGRVAAVVVLGLATAGCTTWVKPGASEYDRQAAMAQCEVASLQMAPPQMYTAMASEARQDAATQSCSWDGKGNRSCTTVPGQRRAARYEERDANQSARRAIVRDCMFSKGWREE